MISISTGRDGNVYSLVSLHLHFTDLGIGHSDWQCPLIATENSYASQLEEVNYWARNNWKLVCLRLCFLVNTLYCIPRSCCCADKDEKEN